ncbi:unnamed protein product [Onchocerca flexuosa]|uniref:Diguanylate cyclase n=1 Tax=Onchocerca flexuosa TaxID=387005 RepID=A0A183HQK2_9BILA|nr:unnamed protein product [Onchocerca flexuosa]
MQRFQKNVELITTATVDGVNGVVALENWAK